jgi:hypothetical protein
LDREGEYPYYLLLVQSRHEINLGGPVIDCGEHNIVPPLRNRQEHLFLNVIHDGNLIANGTVFQLRQEAGGKGIKQEAVFLKLREDF